MKDSLFSLRALLMIDGLSAFFSAGLTLVLSSYLAEFLMLPATLLQVFSVVTVVYGSVALLLMNRSPRHWAPKVFVLANWAWVMGTLLLLVLNYSDSNAMGVSFFLTQALFVIVLTMLQSQKVTR